MWVKICLFIVGSNCAAGEQGAGGGWGRECKCDAAFEQEARAASPRGKNKRESGKHQQFVQR